MLASAAAGVIASVGSEALRHARRRRAAGDDTGGRPATTTVPVAPAEGEDRERAVLDVLASGDPARLVVFTLRRARGYAEQAHRRATEPGAEATTEPPNANAPRHRTELDRLVTALDRFQLSGVPADDLLAVRRLERWAASLAATGLTDTDPPADEGPPT